MGQTLEISPRTAELVESFTRHAGVSVDEFVRSLLPASEDLELGFDRDSAEFERDMRSMSYQGASYR